MKDEEVLELIQKKLTVPVPVAGRACGLSRGSAYAAALRGEIPTIRIGKRESVPTSWLRQKLGLVA